MTPHERWVELKKRVDQHEAAIHLGVIVGNHIGDRRAHYGFNTALEWVEEQMRELEEK